MNEHLIEQNFHRVCERVTQAAQRAGRQPEAVRLVVVTKGHPLPAVEAAIAAGARHLGENYVQEAVAKIEALEGAAVTWHMIGHVQSRKARSVVEHFAWLHSLDRMKLASRLSRFAVEFERDLPLLLECNVSGEASKSGWPAWDEAGWPALAEALAPVLDLPRLDVRGLMTMPPFTPDPEDTRPHFQRLRRLRDFLAKRFPAHSWEELSMGMSHDYEIAIQEGATMVRVGTAIMGPRPVPGTIAL